MLHARARRAGPGGEPVNTSSRKPPAAAEGFVQEFRIAVAGLAPGMFVARLDRAWVGSGFPLQGVLLSTVEEVERLRRMCQYVHVDVSRGLAPDIAHIVLDSELAPTAPPAAPPPSSLGERVRDLMQSFRSEVPHAEKAHETLQSSIRGLMDDIRGGGRLDVEKLASGVDTMLDSVSRNPSAMAWVMQMRRSDEYLYQHALACSVWAATFGRHLGLERPDLRDLALGALLCDVGTVRLNPRVLAKSGRLDDEELRHVRGHVVESERIVESTSGLSPTVRDTVASHHERHDGSGYPRGLKETAIPMYARIAGIVDSYDAMTSNRPYAAMRSPHQAIMELYEQRDRLFQAELVEQFIRVCGVYPTGSLVELTDGTVGVVTAVNSLRRLRPCVLLLLDADKQPLPEFVPVDLSVSIRDPLGEPLNVRGSLPHGAFGIDRTMLFLD